MRVLIRGKLGFYNCWEVRSNSKKSLRSWNKDYRTNATGEGEVARHLCDNSRCFNPMHLIRGSQSENMRDIGRKRKLLAINSLKRSHIDMAYKKLRFYYGEWYIRGFSRDNAVLKYAEDLMYGDILAHVLRDLSRDEYLRQDILSKAIKVWKEVIREDEIFILMEDEIYAISK